MKKLILIIALLLPVSVNAGGLMMSSGTIAAASAGSGSSSWGYTTQDANYQQSSANIQCAAIGSPSNNATVGTISLYSSNATAALDIKVGLYEDSSGTPTTLVGSEEEFVDVGTWSLDWHDFNLTTGLSVSSSKSYWICMHNSATSIYIYYDTAGSANSHWYSSHTYTDAWPATLLSPTGNQYTLNFKAYYSW